MRTTLQFEKEANRRSSRASGGPANLPPAPTQATSHLDQGVVPAARSSPPPRARQYPTSAFPQKEKGASVVCGVGLVLERTEGSGLMVVKKIVKDSIVETDGRISINDTLLKVCASCSCFRMYMRVGFREALCHGCALMSDTSLPMTFVCALHHLMDLSSGEQCGGDGHGFVRSVGLDERSRGLRSASTSATATKP